MVRKLEDGILGETLGDEAQGMVVIDPDGHPQKYDQMEIMSSFVAKEVNVLKVDVPRAGGKGWKRANSEINTQDTDLGDNWCQEAVLRCQAYIGGDVGQGERAALRIRLSMFETQCSLLYCMDARVVYAACIFCANPRTPKCGLLHTLMELAANDQRLVPDLPRLMHGTQRR